MAQHNLAEDSRGCQGMLALRSVDTDMVPDQIILNADRPSERQAD